MPLHAQKIPCLLSYDFKKNGEIFNWNTYHGYTKFLVMRDPYDRLVSYYSNRFLRQFIQRKAKQSKRRDRLACPWSAAPSPTVGSKC